jgi:hypothetical protein
MQREWSLAAAPQLISTTMTKCFASDFASLSDLAAFNKAKKAGMSDKQAFAKGDNGIGCWGDLTAQEHTPMCAVPPEDMKSYFGSKAGAKHQRVHVKLDAVHSVVCVIADIMPARANIKNGCGIDLNPAALLKLGLKSPIKTTVEWWPV